MAAFLLFLMLMNSLPDNLIKEPIVEALLQHVFPEFNLLLSKRLDNTPILMIGEDSIRFDFFCALSKKLQLESWELQLEYPAHADSFILRSTANSKRKEKPQIDLIITNNKFKSAYEFGLSRRNSNPKGTVNKTGRTLKMINDFVRLGINKHFTNLPSFFVCVADSFMLSHRMDSKIYESFPASEYFVSATELSQLRASVKTGSFFDERFMKKAEELKLLINAKLIFTSSITATTLEHETKILTWEINSEIKN